MKAKICVSLLPKDLNEAKNLIEKAEKREADLIEIRFDYLDSSIDLNEISKCGSSPKIAATLSNKSQTNNQKFLLKAARSGFEYVDIALGSVNQKNLIKKVKALNCKPIVSFHDFTGPLSILDLENILEQEISIGAEVCKIVPTAKKIQDNLEIINFVSKNSSSSHIVSFCMGQLGRLSRVLSPLFGGFFTFASLESGLETANGQLSIQELRELYKKLE